MFLTWQDNKNKEKYFEIDFKGIGSYEEFIEIE